MKKLIPILYTFSIFVACWFVWYAGPEDKMLKLLWTLPGLLSGSFSILWEKITKLEKKILILEKEIEEIKISQTLK